MSTRLRRCGGKGLHSTGRGHRGAVSGAADSPWSTARDAFERSHAVAISSPRRPSSNCSSVVTRDELRRRYLGDSAAETPLGADSTGVEGSDQGADESSDDEDEIVVLNPRSTGADPWAPGPGRKSVIVSGKERRVIAEQG